MNVKKNLRNKSFCGVHATNGKLILQSFVTLYREAGTLLACWMLAYQICGPKHVVEYKLWIWHLTTEQGGCICKCGPMIVPSLLMNWNDTYLRQSSRHIFEIAQFHSYPSQSMHAKHQNNLILIFSLAIETTLFILMVPHWSIYMSH